MSGESGTELVINFSMSPGATVAAHALLRELRPTAKAQPRWGVHVDCQRCDGTLVAVPDEMTVRPLSRTVDTDDLPVRRLVVDLLAARLEWVCPLCNVISVLPIARLAVRDDGPVHVGAAQWSRTHSEDDPISIDYIREHVLNLPADTSWADTISALNRRCGPWHVRLRRFGRITLRPLSRGTMDNRT